MSGGQRHRLQIAIGGTQVAGTRYVVDYPPGVGLPILGRENAVHHRQPALHQPVPAAAGHLRRGLDQPLLPQAREFKVILDGIFAINSQDLIVEPYTTKTIHRLWRPRSFLGGAATDAAVFQLFGHMHKRGREFDIDLVDHFCTGDCNADRQVTSASCSAA